MSPPPPPPRSQAFVSRRRVNRTPVAPSSSSTSATTTPAATSTTGQLFIKNSRKKKPAFLRPIGGTRTLLPKNAAAKQRGYDMPEARPSFPQLSRVEPDLTHALVLGSRGDQSCIAMQFRAPGSLTTLAPPATLTKNTKLMVSDIDEPLEGAGSKFGKKEELERKRRLRMEHYMNNPDRLRDSTYLIGDADERQYLAEKEDSDDTFEYFWLVQPDEGADTPCTVFPVDKFYHAQRHFQKESLSVEVAAKIIDQRQPAHLAQEMLRMENAGYNIKDIAASSSRNAQRGSKMLAHLDKAVEETTGGPRGKGFITKFERAIVAKDDADDLIDKAERKAKKSQSKEMAFSRQVQGIYAEDQDATEEDPNATEEGAEAADSDTEELVGTGDVTDLYGLDLRHKSKDAQQHQEEEHLQKVLDGEVEDIDGEVVLMEEEEGESDAPAGPAFANIMVTDEAPQDEEDYEILQKLLRDDDAALAGDSDDDDRPRLEDDDDDKDDADENDEDASDYDSDEEEIDPDAMDIESDSDTKGSKGQAKESKKNGASQSSVGAGNTPAVPLTSSSAAPSASSRRTRDNLATAAKAAANVASGKRLTDPTPESPEHRLKKAKLQSAGSDGRSSHQQASSPKDLILDALVVLFGQSSTVSDKELVKFVKKHLQGHGLKLNDHHDVLLQRLDKYTKKKPNKEGNKQVFRPNKKLKAKLGKGAP